METSLTGFRFFDPDADLAVTERRLPHWAQSESLCFLTWRTWDSIPKHVLDQWLSARASWLAKRGIDPLGPNWRQGVRLLSAGDRCDFYQSFCGRWHEMLDACGGACVFRNPELAEIVARSLFHFDGERYTLVEFVVMPNHVHVIATFPDEERMLTQCESWKHFTAVRINKALGRSGRFWQVDGFDHLLRSEQQFEALRGYIATNPHEAGLRPGEYIHYSRELNPK